MQSSEPKSGPASIVAGLRATWVGVAANIFLVGLKLTAGLKYNSQALIADGIHSASDLFSDFVVILGLKWGRKSEDADHPFGHARIETISSLVIGLILISVGVGITYQAVFSIFRHEVTQPSLYAVYAAGISVVIKEALFWYTLRIGKQLKSLALIGNAWHHRADALSSVAVLVGVGIGLVKPEWYLADSLAAMLVTYFVVKVGLNLVWAAFKELSDTAPDREVLVQLSERAARVNGVIQVHDMRARHSGSQIFVEVHIVVDPDLTVREGHEIAAGVKHGLLDDFPDVTRVITHVDPVAKPDQTSLD